jgi:outer membrane lipase/esterase
MKIRRATESKAFKLKMLKSAAPLALSLAASVGTATCAAISSAHAGEQQLFNQMVVFGDESVDAGFYKSLFPGAGSPTTNPGLMNSQILAAYFGLTANPVNQPGGTNYANAGAGAPATIPTFNQFENYFGDSGRANPNALYLISTGESEVAQVFASGIADKPAAIKFDTGFIADYSGQALQRGGARYIIVPNLFYISTKVDPEQSLRKAYNQSIWASFSSDGVKFIPADYDALGKAVTASPSQFGLTNVTDAACMNPAALATNWALSCTPALLVTPNANLTYLFADDHNPTTAGQQIEADYLRSLLVAPGEISLLAENAVRTRTATVTGIQDQIDIARRRPTPGFNVWFSGDISSLKLDSALGFPGDTAASPSGTVGLDYRSLNGLLFGGAVTVGTQTPSFTLGGNFREKELAGSLYGGYFNGPSWLSVIGTYGGLNYDVNRIVPIGISLQYNHATTNGSDMSLAVQSGYDFHTDNITHGPVAGLTWQRVRVSGFTETGGFTSLGFGDQTRISAISSLGYKAAVDYGRYRPFAQLTWDHELGILDRSVTTTLTTSAAPSYDMPAVKLGRDWATATVGTTMTIAPGFTGLAALTAQTGQTGANIYGGRVALNYAIGADGPQAQVQPDAANGAASTPPWAPWIVTSSGEVRVISWRNNLTTFGQPAGSGAKGSEVYIPYGLQLNGKIFDNLDAEIVGRGGWVNANNHTLGLSGEIGTPTDTALSATFTYTGANGIQPFVAIQTNLPTGTSVLPGNAPNARMDPDLVDITSFGEGFNLGGTVGVNFLLSSAWTLTTSAGYTTRGAFDRDGPLTPVFEPVTTTLIPTSRIKSGDDFSLVQAVTYTQGSFTDRLSGTMSIDSSTIQDGVQVLRPGNRYFLSNDTTYAWSDVIGATTLSASVAHSNRNNVYDVTSSALVKEITDTNSNVYRVSMQHMFPIGSFALGPTVSYLYRDHNGYDPETLQFVPAKQRYSAGVLARYTPTPTMTFNARVEAIWTHEDVNPATDDQKFSPFAGDFVPQLALPVVSSMAWQTALGFNYKL